MARGNGGIEDQRALSLIPYVFSYATHPQKSELDRVQPSIGQSFSTVHIHYPINLPFELTDIDIRAA